MAVALYLKLWLQLTRSFAKQSEDGSDTNVLRQTRWLILDWKIQGEFLIHKKTQLVECFNVLIISIYLFIEGLPFVPMRQIPARPGKALPRKIIHKVHRSVIILRRSEVAREMVFDLPRLRLAINHYPTRYRSDHRNPNKCYENSPTHDVSKPASAVVS